MMKKNKKGLEAETIVSIILILLGAAIIFYYFTILNPKQTIDKETCRESVVMRNLPIVGGAEKISTPLRCKTQEILIDSKDYRTEEQVKAKIANEMYDCWWMLGEGKLSPFSKPATESMALAGSKSGCAICSVISFDDKWKEKNQNLDMMDYILTQNVPTKDITYADYFLNGESTELPTAGKVVEISTDKEYTIVFFGFESQSVWNVLKKDLFTAAGIDAGSFLVAKKLPISGSLVKGLNGAIVSGAVSLTALIAAAAVIGTAEWQTLTALDSQKIAAGYCNGDKKGCYQIILMDYNAKDIAGFCGEIQSIP